MFHRAERLSYGRAHEGRLDDGVNPIHTLSPSIARGGPTGRQAAAEQQRLPSTLTKRPASGRTNLRQPHSDDALTRDWEAAQRMAVHN
jgi:hypothetical protein